ncbi:iron uptake porin [Aetokthonos hydrillicola]|jgi:hypothetical protein|nr:iron uptake porin [Aetokthonos hydrillicola]MBO3460046.1 iron uptake porin [Aetokthonos hydrillicola CCALA 1050]MBW4584643.1 iron uptake porin [Aetokthonos hydrillicola CCALA 1050]
MCSPLEAANSLQISLPDQYSSITDKESGVTTKVELPKLEVSRPEKNSSFTKAEFSVYRDYRFQSAKSSKELRKTIALSDSVAYVAGGEQLADPAVVVDHPSEKQYNSPSAPLFLYDVVLGSHQPENLNIEQQKKLLVESPRFINEQEQVKSEELTEQNSVSELSDVKPTDWAYQALRSLTIRYGVTLGYPNGIFAGNRSLSRYEFAAGLAAVLEKVNSIIGSAVGNPYVQEDMMTLRRLQKEYRSALDQLQHNVDSIAIRSAKLTAEQFSLTTKLQSQTIIGFTNGSNANSTMVARSRLTLSTSFHAQNILVTQLESGNNGLDAIGRAQNKNLKLLGTTGLIANGGGLDYGEYGSNVTLRRLYYSFHPTKNLGVTVGAKMLPRDFIDRNRYANNEAIDFSSSFFLHNPLIVQNQIDRGGGAGAAIAWNPGGGKFTLRSLYIAADANQFNSARNTGGLFGDRHQTSVELEYAPSRRLGLRLQYTNALINNTDINAFGVNAEYSFNRSTGIFSRLGFGNYQGFNTAINRRIDLQPFSWVVGLGFRDLFVPGTLAGIAIGQPFVTNGLGNTTQTNFETFYNLKLNDNISITPTFSWVTNANNDSSNGTTWEGTFRTVFSF